MVRLADEGRPSPSRAPVTAQVALAIEILIKAPMRMGNLIGLRLDEHIHRRNGLVHIVVPGGTVKNGERLFYQLGSSSSEMFEKFVRFWRPKLRGAECPYLFATENGGKSAATLAEQISDAIRKHVGIRMSPHQFRHLAAELTLEARPGAHRMASTLLGHKSPHTAPKFYVANDVRRANEQYDQIVEAQRAMALAPAKRKVRR
jgi:integrase